MLYLKKQLKRSLNEAEFDRRAKKSWVILTVED